MFITLKEWRARSARDAALRADLKARVKTIFGLGDCDSVSVNEIACLDPGCPDVETVILLMRAGEPTVAVKVPAYMQDITDIEIECLAALRPRRSCDQGAPPDATFQERLAGWRSGSE